jgi:hypothetical protein
MPYSKNTQAKAACLALAKGTAAIESTEALMLCLIEAGAIKAHDIDEALEALAEHHAERAAQSAEATARLLHGGIAEAVEGLIMSSNLRAVRRR